MYLVVPMRPEKKNSEKKSWKMRSRIMQETIITKLKEEHRGLHIMLLKIERCKDLKKKQIFYEEIKKVLIPHMAGKEQTLYAKIRNEFKAEGATELAKDADYELQQIKGILAMLDEIIFGSDQWNDLFSDLKENILVHLEDEETKVFPEVREDFSRDELVNIALEFKEAKEHASYH
jgi:iron-sulfur cluster repair protein YtfE (RIC family)